MEKTGNLFSQCVLRFCLFALTLFFVQAAAADSKVSVRVDRDQMGIGDAFTFTLTVQSDGDFELAMPQLPKIAGLEEINSTEGGRQSSSSMSIINGKTQFVSSTSQDYHYLLSPQKEGVFIIPVIDVVINGKTYKTQPIKIEVKEEFRNAPSKGHAKAKRRFPPGFGGQPGDQDAEEDQDPFGGLRNAEDLFEQMLQQQQRMFGGGGGLGRSQRDDIQSRQLDVNTNEPFFLYLDVDKTEVYEGEQITANWYIYTRANVESLDRVKFPDLKGFWKEIIEEVPALQFGDEIVNGVHYRKALLASHALFPIKPGTAVIDEFRIKAKIRSNQFGGRSTETTKASKRTSIKVLPLPQEGKTVSFSGAVGNYRVTLKTDSNSYPAHQPFSVKVRYEGLGNAKLIDLPQITWPEGLEVYDTKSEAKFFKEGNSYKEFEILVIPRKEGEMKIPALSLTFFEPALKKYISEMTQEITLQITPGQPNAPGVSSASSGGQADAQGFVPQAILQLPEAQFSLRDYRIPIYLSFLLLGVLGILGWAVMQLKNLNFESEVFSNIAGKLSKIEQHQASQDVRKIGSEATNLIYLLVAQLAGQKKADQEIHLLMKEISSKDQQRFISRINILFDYFQLLGFSPDEIMQAAINKKPIAEQIRELKALTKEIVEKLKKEDKTNK